MTNQIERKSIWQILTKPFRTKQYLISSSITREINIQDVCIVQNDTSLIIPMGVYPSFQEIHSYVKDSRPPIVEIESIISTELENYGINSTISKDGDSISCSYHIIYQDYWAWDFKKYMPVLRMSLLDSQGNTVISLASEGNTTGMHDYPNPKKQVPKLIGLMVKQIRKK